jgi:hypothetical protein
MEYTRGIRARLPFRMPDAKAFGGRLVHLVLVLGAVLVLQACDGKESGFFAPAITINIPSPADLDGVWSVNYRLVPASTTCEDSPSSFAVDAEMSTFSTNGTVTLDVLIEESPVPIRGAYVVETGVFVGETGPVDAGNGELSNQTWDVRFLTDSRNVPTFSGTAVEEISSGGATVCETNFEIAGSKLVAVPT